MADRQRNDAGEETDMNVFLSSPPMPSFNRGNNGETHDASSISNLTDDNFAVRTHRRLKSEDAAHITALKGKLMKIAPDAEHNVLQDNLHQRKHDSARAHRNDPSWLDDEEARTPSLLVMKYSQVDTVDDGLDETTKYSHAQMLDDGPPSVTAFFNDDDDVAENIQDSEKLVDSVHATVKLSNKADAAGVGTGLTENPFTTGQISPAMQQVMLRAPSSDQFILRCFVTSTIQPQSHSPLAANRPVSTLPNNLAAVDDCMNADPETRKPVNMPISAENVIAALYVDDETRQAGVGAAVKPVETLTPPVDELSDSGSAAAENIFAKVRAELMSRIAERNMQPPMGEQQQQQPLASQSSRDANYEAYFDDDFDSGADVLDEPNNQTEANATLHAEHVETSAEQLPLANSQEDEIDNYDLNFDSEESAESSVVEKRQLASLMDLPAMQTASLFAEISRRASMRQLQTNSHNSTTFRALVCYFNYDPFRALHYMIANGFVAGTAQHICEQFLLPNSDTEMCTRSTLGRGVGCVCRLSRLRLGELLCDAENSASHELLKHWLSIHSFAGVSVEVALRTLLRTFAPPRDTVAIQHLCRMFAHRYTECQHVPIATDTKQAADEQLNPDANVDFERRAKINEILSSAILLLNADLHNIELSNSLFDAETTSSAAPANTKKRKKVKKLPVSFETFQADLERSLSSATNGSDDERATCPMSTRQLEHLYDSIRLSPITCEPDHIDTLFDLNSMFSSTRSSRKRIPARFSTDSQRWLIAYYHGVVEFKPSTRKRKNKKASTQQQQPTAQQYDRRSSYYQHQRGSILRTLVLRLISSAGRRQQSKAFPTSTAGKADASYLPSSLYKSSGIDSTSLSDFELKHRVLILLNDMVLVARETRREVWKRRYIRGGIQARTRRGAPRGLRLCRALPLQAASNVQCLALPRGSGDDAVTANFANVAVIKPTLAVDNDSSEVCRFTHPSAVLLSEMCEQIRQAIEANAELLRLRPLLDECAPLSLLPMLPNEAFMPTELKLLQ